jgi:lipoprotein-anchoring transpeptidase ErfK/SrfK
MPDLKKGIMWVRLLMTGLMIFGAVWATCGQGYVDQEAVAPLLESQGSTASVRAVTWHRYNIGKAGRTGKAMLERLQAHIDSLPGDRTEQRMEIVELSNRVRTKYMMQRGSLLIPDSFPQDFRAYTPYPMEYPGAAELPRLFIIDKYTQTFAAYEHGQLVRWGLACSGRNDNQTPAGRYSFNWKDEYRESTEAPPGEVWKMRWVVNVYDGIHVHQYQLPIASPSSHGCIRISESDAFWNFNWAESSKMQGGKLVRGTPVLIINHNPAGLAAHWSEEGASLVNLPDDPMSIPFGPARGTTVARE